MSAKRFEAFMKTVAAFEEVVTTRTSDQARFFFEVRTGQGRSQVVMAQCSEAEDGELLVHMMTEIGPAQESLYAAMLARNLELRYGRIAEVAGAEGRSFALVYAYPLAELEEAEFARAFGEVAFVADAIERACYGKDRG